MLMTLALLACTDSSEDSGDSACTESTWYLDADGDGFGDADRTLDACEAPSAYVADDTDCADLDADVNPDAALPTWHRDGDGDGFGDASAPRGRGLPWSGWERVQRPTARAMKATKSTSGTKAWSRSGTGR
ncbi:MAG: hypothetical protein GY913_12905 [Proteobacteria bacterium]|nr:hypothetical protein [Pseudomonadota bacterium]MCP4917806.1 hypothetical protein [Pseudomonadota bacterium]